MELTHFIQWNCRGLRANYNEIELLLNRLNPIAICLQETLLPEKYTLSMRQYTVFTNTRSTSGGHPCGGTAIIVNKKIPHSHIKINTRLQVTCVRISYPKPITICSVYLPPSFQWDTNDLLNVIDQLPRPILLMGDFNAHSSLWGCSKTDSKGDQIENFLSASNMCLLNNKSHTYIHPATGAHSSIDLSICDPDIFLDLVWSVNDDLCGSDHYPIFVSIPSVSPVIENQRWKLKKADWDTFSSLCSSELRYENLTPSDNAIHSFSSTLLEICNKTIPKTKPTGHCRQKPWFSDDCKQAIKDRKTAISEFKRNPSDQNLARYRIMRAKARRTIRHSKRTSWQSYVSKLSSKTPMKKIWDMVRKISGKPSSPTISHLKDNNNIIEEPISIVNTLGSTIANNSSSTRASKSFHKYKSQQEKNPIKFESDNTEIYNLPFCLSELEDSLKQSHDTSTGPDNIHYQMLKHLPYSALETLLRIFNDIWTSGNFPPTWSEAIVIPINKPGKDPADPNNYRPIALTSCVCKTLERMINNRLVWYLEKNNIISELQSGFRKRRSTVDHLVRLESFIREGLARREHVVAVFFDLEKAYDTTWKYGILRDMFNAGLRGRLPSFIANFLSDRHFRVRIGSFLSDLFDQEMGVPQGSILSVTLFTLKINSIVNCLPVGVRGSLYVDDFLICYRSKNMRSIERQLQCCLNRVQTWADENGFKFSESKTVAMHFCNNHTLHPDPHLTLYNSPIPVVEETKFLGLIFDRKLSFIPHIKYLKDKCLKAMNLLRVVAHTDWGADAATLLRLYRSHIRSKLDYGCIVYGSARETYLLALDRVQNQALRLCLGAFRTSPITSLHVESNEMPLQLRRERLALNYTLQLQSNPNNPAYNCVFHSQFETLFDSKPNVIPTPGIRFRRLIANAGINTNHIATANLPATPLWLLKPCSFIYTLQDIGKKSNTPPHLFINKYNEIRNNLKDYIAIFTDGSKCGPAVAAAALSAPLTLCTRLPDNSSIFSAETQAINLALDIIETNTHTRFVIFSDSLSCLQAIENRLWNNPLILSILNRLHNLNIKGYNILFVWLPSHVGIRGNAEADMAAKSALTLTTATNTTVPFSDFKPLITTFLNKKWQLKWDLEINNKLHSLQPKTGLFISSNSLSRRDERVFHRLRIGHTHLTHAYLLKNEDPPECIPCHSRLTVEHILISCCDFDIIRSKFYSVSTMSELFSTINADTIVKFIKEIGLYYKI